MHVAYISSLAIKRDHQTSHLAGPREYFQTVRFSGVWVQLSGHWLDNAPVKHWSVFQLLRGCLLLPKSTRLIIHSTFGLFTCVWAT